MVIAGAGDVQGPTTRGVAILQLKSTHEADFSIQVNAFVLTKITVDLPTHRIGIDRWRHLQGLSLADPNFGSPGEIDLLIGADVWGLIIKDGLINGEANQPHAQNTHLGWVVSGPVDLIHCNLAQSMHVRGNENLEEALTRFWLLEEPTLSKVDTHTDECEQHYEATVHRQDDGRYVVSIPFLKEEPTLGDSRRMAMQQFYRNERRLHSDPDLLAKYVQFMREYEAWNHMALYEGEVGEGTPSYYIPHHAVTSKFRVVFNASAKSDNGVSLNDTQHIGPVIQDKLANIILRFRLYRVAVVADIEKMFRQVLVHPNQQKWQLILWRENPNDQLNTYRLTTVTYGTRSGPYLAVRTLHQCARDNYSIIKQEAEANEARHSIEKDFYVDDYLSSAPTPAIAIRRSKNVDHVLQQGHMHLRKWQCNNKAVVQAIIGQSDSGLQWDSEFDKLSFDITLDEATTRTKRTCLSDIAKLYDPTGLLAPVVIKAKIFMQRLWLAGVGWDEEIPNELLQEWSVFRHDLFQLVNLAIPRHIGMHPGQQTTLHGFCDASQCAYAAAIYVRTIDEFGQVTVRLLASKTRVAPVKTISIPRLELCGAQLLVTTINTVREAMEMMNVEYFLWTDSTIVLAWLRQLPVRFKPYVANKVSYVQQNSDPSAWHHIPTAHNPADCASRGLTPSQIQAHTLWWTGPGFLQQGNLYNTASKPLCSQDDLQNLRQEERLPVVTYTRIENMGLLMTRRRDGLAINFLDRTNSLTKIKRIMAHILYALYAGSKKRVTYGSEICSVERLHQAMQVLTRLDQRQWFKRDIESCNQAKNLPGSSTLSSLNPFIDEGNILRVGGRIKRSTLDANQRFPIILSREGKLAYMIVAEVHRTTLHGGVQLMLQIIRQTHWIIGGRALVKSYIHKCVTCRLQRGKVARQRTGDLPKYRITRHRPFFITGVDYCGPFLLRLGAKRSRTITKTYVVIFVCLATKAVHIELATDLSTEAFLNAFARFTSRRGPCEQLHSDNGTNFQGANRRMKEDLEAWHCEHVKEQLTHRGTTWHFIPPSAPHQGGIWEAAVKSAKRHIVRVVGSQTMSYEQFNTLLIRIEACLNSRPLVALYDDPDDKLALTPGDFLTGGPIIALPEPTVMNLPLNRIKEWNLVRRWTEDIWQRWHQEYLTTLQQRSKWRKAEENIKVGDIVAIKQDNLPPTHWCLGRVTVEVKIS
ncbi:uncharacterized protein LOC129940343 [Eupeodes corollae]|uniref:uncharacterized protein LOC129940343 n=1 Tax=Eupeodes corollae TaxID=290404 RepID=UPI002490B54F|nr:uncharacterized protein LOC129940343 [Eupeodes corollae]